MGAGALDRAGAGSVQTVAGERQVQKTRFDPPAAGGADAALRPYRQRIDRIFSTGYDRPRVGDGRRIVAAYRKASGDLAGAMELMLYVVEAGTRYTRAFGDVDGPFYIALESMLMSLAEELRTDDGRPHYPALRPRLQRIAEEASHIGYGYGDEVAAIIDSLEDLGT